MGPVLSCRLFRRVSTALDYDGLTGSLSSHADPNGIPRVQVSPLASARGVLLKRSRAAASSSGSYPEGRGFESHLRHDRTTGAPAVTLRAAPNHRGPLWDLRHRKRSLSSCSQEVCGLFFVEPYVTAGSPGVATGRVSLIFRSGGGWKPPDVIVRRSIVLRQRAWKARTVIVPVHDRISSSWP